MNSGDLLGGDSDVVLGGTRPIRIRACWSQGGRQRDLEQDLTIDPYIITIQRLPFQAAPHWGLGRRKVLSLASVRGRCLVNAQAFPEKVV